MTKFTFTTQKNAAAHSGFEVQHAGGDLGSAKMLQRKVIPVPGIGHGSDSLHGKIRPNIIKLIQGHQTYIKNMEPRDLLNPFRFDLVAKYIYARHKILNIDSQWALRLYTEHLRVFNGIAEPDGSGKTGVTEFVSSFNNTLNSIYTAGFVAKKSLIPVGHNYILLDGSHRVAACLLFNRQLTGLLCDVPAFVYDHQFFRNYTEHVPTGLAANYLDAMALEYCRLKKNTYIVTVFPSAIGKEAQVRDILGEYGELFYFKTLTLTGQGPTMLMRQMYSDENWLGTWDNNFQGAVLKAHLCFRQPGPVRVYGFESDHLQKVNEAKRRIRDLFKIDNHSVHINDTHEETLRLAGIFFNANSIHFLNHAGPRPYARFHSLLEYYSDWLRNQDTDPENFCIDGSAVLAAYGIRDAKDLDFLFFGADDVDTGHRLVSCHNHEVHHYTTSRDDIIFNPNNHFYFDGVKFAALDVIGSMKQKRAEDKDKRDIALIDIFLRRANDTPRSASVATVAQGPTGSSGSKAKDDQMVGLIFSKDRAMQLDGVLRSFKLHCLDSEYLDLKVLYRATDELHRVQYRQLISDYTQVKFCEEADFKNDMLSLLSTYEYVLFLVDDNIFVREFCLEAAIRSLGQHPESLGFSLRLGKNITKRLYPRQKNWIIPEFTNLEDKLLKFDWTAGDADQGYGYPLEVSSSIYRMRDLYLLLENGRYSNPNTLEYILDQHKAGFRGASNGLLCYDQSVTFCNPVNLVQTAWINHAGNNDRNSADALSKKFSDGYRIDVGAYAGFVPHAYHQEVELIFKKQPDRINPDPAAKPVSLPTLSELTSIVILNFNGLEHIKICISSIRERTSSPYDIIVVDNASSDGSVEYLRKQTDIVLVENKTNIGCPPARAQAMALARGQYVVMLDNDTVVTPGWLTTLINYFKTNPDVGLLGPRSNFVSGQQLVPDAAYGSIEELKEFARSFSEKHRGQLTTTFRLVGFCLAIRREVITKIGSLDSRFGKFGFEDDDYTYRAIIAGFRAAIAHDVFIHHTGGPQVRGDADYNKNLLEAWDIFKRKWGLPPELTYDKGFRLASILSRPFDPAAHFIPLLDKSTVDPLVYRSRPGPDLPVAESKSHDVIQGRLENPTGSKNHMTPPDLGEHHAGNQKIDAFFQRVDRLFHSGSLQPALDLLRGAIYRAAHEKLLYFKLCEILIESAYYQDALEFLNNMPGQEPDYRQLELKGSCLAGLDRYEEADTCAEKAISLQADSAPAWCLKGISAGRAGNGKAAISFFNHSIDLDPAFGPAYTHLGLTELEFGDAAKALQLLKKGFQVCPTDGFVHNTFYSVITEIEAYDQAEALFQKASSRFPHHKKLAYLYIDILVQQAKNRLALNAIEKAIACFGIDDGILAPALKIREKLGEAENLSHETDDISITLCMIVKNEEKHLAQCLYHAKPVIDEMIVVDTGSEDRTVDIARVFGAHVYSHEWRNDFAAARNLSIGKANGQWLLILDADEVLADQDYQAISDIVKSQSDVPCAYSFTTRNYTNDAGNEGWQPNDGQYQQEQAGRGWYPSTKVRLFPNDKRVCFENAVHELVEPSLRRAGIAIQNCGVPIHHYGTLLQKKNLDKKDNYLDLGRKKVAGNQSGLAALVEHAIQVQEVGDYKKALHIWQDVLNQCPDLPKAHFNLSYVYIQLERYGQGLESAKRCMQLDPHLKEAVLNYSLCMIRTGQVKLVVERLEGFLIENPNHPMGKGLLAVAYCILNENEKGLRLLNEIKEMGYNSAEYVWDHARKMLSAGRQDEVSKLLQAVKNSPYADNKIQIMLNELSRHGSNPHRSGSDLSN